MRISQRRKERKKWNLTVGVGVPQRLLAFKVQNLVFFKSV